VCFLEYTFFCRYWLNENLLALHRLSFRRSEATEKSHPNLEISPGVYPVQNRRSLNDNRANTEVFVRALGRLIDDLISPGKKTLTDLWREEWKGKFIGKDYSSVQH
jgi:hypothetical protein